MTSPKREDRATALLIRGGRVIDPAAGLDTVHDVLIEQGKIARVGARLSAARITCTGAVMARQPSSGRRPVVAIAHSCTTGRSIASVFCRRSSGIAAQVPGRAQ